MEMFSLKNLNMCIKKVLIKLTFYLRTQNRADGYKYYYFIGFILFSLIFHFLSFKIDRLLFTFYFYISKIHEQNYSSFAKNRRYQNSLFWLVQTQCWIETWRENSQLHLFVYFLSSSRSRPQRLLKNTKQVREMCKNC